MAYSYQNPYMNYGNQFYSQPVQTPRFQTPDQQQFAQYNQPVQPIQQIAKVQPTLQGKSVDSIDVVKAMDIPLDYSVSYFPLTDGSAIITKQLQVDGTSKTIVYKPVDVEQLEEKQLPKYLTIDEFNEKLKSLDNTNNTKDLKEEIKNLKKQIKNLTDELDELKEKED